MMEKSILIQPDFSLEDEIEPTYPSGVHPEWSLQDVRLNKAASCMYINMFFDALRRGANPNIVHLETQMTPMHTPSFMGNFLFCKTLIQCGFTAFNQKSSNWRTPAETAYERRHTDLGDYITREHNRILSLKSSTLKLG